MSYSRGCFADTSRLFLPKVVIYACENYQQNRVRDRCRRNLALDEWMRNDSPAESQSSDGQLDLYDLRMREPAVNWVDCAALALRPR